MNLQELRELKKKHQQKSLGKAFREAKGEHTPDSPTKIWTPGDGPMWIPDPDSIIVIDDETRTIGCKCGACGGVPEGVFMVLQNDADEDGRLRTYSFIPDICTLCKEKMTLNEQAFSEQALRYILPKGANV